MLNGLFGLSGTLRSRDTTLSWAPTQAFSYKATHAISSRSSTVLRPACGSFVFYLRLLFTTGSILSTWLRTVSLKASLKTQDFKITNVWVISPSSACVIPGAVTGKTPPRGRHGQNARDWRGLALPGVQEAGEDLPRGPAPLVPAIPSRTRAPAPLFRVHARSAVSPPPGAVTGKTRGTGGERRCPGCRRPGRTCPEAPRP